jgi:hypothetical protein
VLITETPKKKNPRDHSDPSKRYQALLEWTKHDSTRILMNGESHAWDEGMEAYSRWEAQAVSLWGEVFFFFCFIFWCWGRTKGLTH